MALAIPISYIVCCSIGLILSGGLIRRDAKPYRTNETDGVLRVDRRWEKAMAVVFDGAQVALLVNDITAVSMAIISTNRFNWVNLSITCTLQLIVGTNLARQLRALSIDRAFTYLPYVAIILLTARDVVFYLEDPLTLDSPGLLI
ncbi:hypothetical protein CC78DRAFT_547434 [Lojkania enalia]|uniref:Uncharacterized protein n=1 Tax=Lojkania enalia TaxID=147567 RepID=A0A9P4K5L2_9PLEO|nr:hypothetical protein CC78DRAFT_547434 [Didymosphaeria enalia]